MSTEPTNISNTLLITGNQIEHPQRLHNDIKVLTIPHLIRLGYNKSDTRTNSLLEQIVGT